MEILESILHSFVNLAMLLFEYIGVCVITFSGIQGIVNYIRKSPDTRLVLANGLAMGLEFKLGSEILRTVIVRNLDEIYIVAGIIALRAVLTFLIHWEIKNMEKLELVNSTAQDSSEPEAEDDNQALFAAAPKAADKEAAVKEETAEAEKDQEIPREPSAKAETESRDD